APAGRPAAVLPAARRGPPGQLRDRPHRADRATHRGVGRRRARRGCPCQRGPPVVSRVHGRPGVDRAYDHDWWWKGYGAHMTRRPSRPVVYVPVSGPDARPYLLTCARACERGGYDVVAFTAEPSEVQRMLDRREVDVIVVADVEHRLDLHDA